MTAGLAADVTSGEVGCGAETDPDRRRHRGRSAGVAVEPSAGRSDGEGQRLAAAGRGHVPIGREPLRRQRELGTVDVHHPELAELRFDADRRSSLRTSCPAMRPQDLLPSSRLLREMATISLTIAFILQAVDLRVRLLGVRQIRHDVLVFLDVAARRRAAAVVSGSAPAPDRPSSRRSCRRRTTEPVPSISICGWKRCGVSSW